MTTRCILALLAALACAPSAARADRTAHRRVAVVVGANGAPSGRRPLRFAHADADSMASVLRDLGGFAAADVTVLHDPTPAAVLAAIDRELARAARAGGDTLLVFYYSGHADNTALYPGGALLPLRELRARLDDSRAAVRVGVVDACRGGGWTGAKGLTESEPFDVDLELGLASEGTALIASSSGMEDAHESSLLRGSFFTHHFTVALRGAGDGDRDGQITLTEAFDYAKARTVRDTSLHTKTPQSPSFQYNLRGRRDLPLAALAASKTRLTISQRTGPLQLIHLDTGLVVLEIPRGKRAMTLALAPGRYVVRRVSDGKLLAREVAVRAGRTTRVSEAQLTLVGSGRLAVKGPPGLEPVRRRASRGDELMVSFVFSSPRFQVLDERFIGSERYGTGLDAYLAVLSYLRRHNRYWGTRLSIGGGRQDSNVSGEGALHAAIAEVASLQIDARGELELYAAAELAGQISIFVDPSGAPPQLALSAVAGVRMFSFYADAGGIYDLAPRGGTHNGIDFERNLIGIRVEAGLRFENTLF